MVDIPTENSVAGVQMVGFRRPSIQGPRLAKLAIEPAPAPFPVPPTDTTFLAVAGEPTEDAVGPSFPVAKKSRKFPITSEFKHEGVSYNTSIDYVNPDKISLKIFKSEDNSLVLEQVYERSDADVLKRELLAAGFSDVYVTINKMGVHKDYLVFAAKP